MWVCVHSAFCYSSFQCTHAHDISSPLIACRMSAPSKFSPWMCSCRCSSLQIAGSPPMRTKAAGCWDNKQQMLTSVNLTKAPPVLLDWWRWINSVWWLGCCALEHRSQGYGRREDHSFDLQSFDPVWKNIIFEISQGIKWMGGFCSLLFNGITYHFSKVRM